MNPLKFLPVIVAALALAGPAAAQGKQPKNPSKGHCPPGLAKKNPPCIPPGLAKKGHLPADFRAEDFWILDPPEFGLPELQPGEAYVRIGDIFVKVDRETWEILNLFDALGRVLN